MDIVQLLDLLGYIQFVVIISGFRLFIEIDFLTRFLRVKVRTGVFVLYIGVCLLLSLVMIALQITIWVQFCVHFAIMFMAGMILLNKATVAALAPCIVVTTLFALLDGLSASILRSLMHFIPGRLAWWMIIPFLLSLLLFAAGHIFLRYISVKSWKFNKDYAAAYLHLLLLPCLLTITTVHFNWNLWDDVITVDPNNLKIDYAQVIRDTAIMLFAFLSFIAVLIAFFRLMQSAERDAEKSNLEQQIKIQQQYVAEAKQRNEQYRSFHHDINNHFSVLSGLVSSGKNTEACDYLQKIKSSSDETVGAVNTGNMVLDVLLGEKIAHARRQGIVVTWDMQLDKDLGIDDFDLCILFANALDNAIHACINCIDEMKTIQVTSKIKNDFLFIEIENTCIPNLLIVWGVGLKNMKRTTEKYQGTINTEVSGNHFRLSVLLCLPMNRKILDRSRD